MKEKAKIFWAIFIGLIMISSVLGILSAPEETTYEQTNEYNGKELYRGSNGLWILEENDVFFYFNNLPDDVASIEVPQISINNQKIYFMYDFNESIENVALIASKLRQVLHSQGVIVVDACIKEDGCPDDMPIRDCSNEGFYFKLSENASVYKEDQCYVLEGNVQEINKEVDKINYIILGVY